MRILALCLVAGASLGLPAVAVAQPTTADQTYCAELSHRYEKHVGSPNDKQPFATPACIGSAKGKCQSDPKSAIPILEKALTDKKISLPSHQ